MVLFRYSEPYTHNFLDSQILGWLAYCGRSWRCNWELGGQANLILSISCHSIVLDLLAQQLSGQLRISLRILRCILWPLTSRGQEQMAASGRMAAAAFAFPRQRMYLCNWYVKLVKPGKELPDNHVQCHVPMKWVNETTLLDLAHDLMLFIISSFQEWRNLIFGITLRKSTESRLLKLTPGYSLVRSTAEWGHVITDSPHSCAWGIRHRQKSRLAFKKSTTWNQKSGLHEFVNIRIHNGLVTFAYYCILTGNRRYRPVKSHLISKSRTLCVTALCRTPPPPRLCMEQIREVPLHMNVTLDTRVLIVCALRQAVGTKFCNKISTLIYISHVIHICLCIHTFIL